MDSENILNNQISPEEQKWERSWSTDEIRSNSVKWTLAGDIGLFHLLNDFSQKIISRTHEIENEVDTLVHKTKIASVKISNVINDFHMLSNLQFVENRVYDEEVQDSAAQEKQVSEKSKEQKEAEMLPKVIKAIELGLSVLDQAFDKINVDDISDSEDEDLSSEGRTILEPKDPYEFRSLPYIIGSEEFQNDDFAGLGELCEEEIAEVSAEDQTLSESESSSEEEEPVPMVDSRFDEMPNAKLKAESISDKLSSSDESELFGSEKEDNDEFLPDLSMDAKKNQVDKVLKPHKENIEKDTRHNSVSSIQSRLKLPQVLPSPKQDQNEKDEVDLFANEDISDEESPFRKKTSLFKSDVNFDNEDQDMFSDDLFGEKVKTESISPLPFEKPVIHKESNYSAGKDTKNSTLFGTDDSEDDMFSTLSKAKPSHVTKPVEKEKQETAEKTEKNIKFKSPTLPAKKSEKAFNFKDDTSNSLFGDDSDADDLFSGTKSQKKFNFDAADDDDLFGLVNDKTSNISKEKGQNLSPKSQKSEKDFKLFDDSGSFDQPETPKDKAKDTVKILSQTPKLFSDSDSSDKLEKSKDKAIHTVKIPGKTPKLFGDSDSSDQETLEEVKPAPSTKNKSDSLFDNEDIFSKEPSKSKPVKSLLADKDDDLSLFDDKETPVVPQAKQPSKSAKSLFEESDNFDLFSSKEPKVEKPLLKKSENFQASKNAVASKLTFDNSIHVSEAPNMAEKNLPVKVETPKQFESTEISFDIPVDTSNTLNIVGKDRAKVSTKRRKPTRKGRLAALQSGDSNTTFLEADESSPSISNSGQKITNNQLSQAVKSEEIISTTNSISPSPEKTVVTHKEKEKQKKDLMSQLMSEAAVSRVKRSTVLLEDSDDEVDLFSSKPRASSSKSDFSFLSPVENTLESSKVSSEADHSSDTKSEESEVLPTESADNEDFFTEPSFQGFRTSISHKASILDFDDDDDDLFKNIKDSPLPKVKDSSAANDSHDIFSADADDIFAGLQKEKYEMFPSQLYDADDDDGDIFGSSVKPIVEKVTNNTSSKQSTIKKEPEKKPVNLFDDPLTGLLQE